MDYAVGCFTLCTCLEHLLTTLPPVHGFLNELSEQLRSKPEILNQMRSDLDAVRSLPMEDGLDQIGSSLWYGTLRLFYEEYCLEHFGDLTPPRRRRKS